MKDLNIFIQLKSFTGTSINDRLQYDSYSMNHTVCFRDIKPENILISGEILKIADFGSSVELTKEDERRKSLIGTPHYLSPETIRQTGYSYMKDMWALGIIMYQMIGMFKIK